jgi:uncharacterized BrkB/YihY/UPF0761 family membrane protein
MSLFPLLLVFTTILGFIGNDRIEKTLVGTTLQQLPVFGEQIGPNAPHPLAGSLPALVLGLIVLLYGALGAAQSAQYAMAQVWNVPGVFRPGYFPRLARGLLLFLTIGVGVGLTAGVGAAATGIGRAGSTRVLLSAGDLLLDVGLFLVVFRILTPRAVAMRDLIAGAVLGGIGYGVLVNAGAALAQRQLRHAEAVYGQFGLVLGLISWLYLVAQLTLYAAELNVVRSRHLWPRSIVQPPLTSADERVLADIARQEERRPEEHVDVDFDATGTAASEPGSRSTPPPVSV